MVPEREAKRDAKPARTDFYGDPLPPGAIMRFGSVRLCHPGGCNSIAFAPDGKTLASGGADTVRVWDVATGKQILKLQMPKGKVACVAYSPDGRVLAAGGWQEGVCFWEVATGQESRRPWKDLTEIRSIAFSPDGKTIAVGSTYGKLHLLETATGKRVRTLDLAARSGDVCGLAFAHDGNKLAAVSASCARLWDVNTGKELLTTSGGAPAFSRNGKILATTGREFLRLWDTTSAKLLLEWAANDPNLLAFSPDSKWIASGSPLQIRIWETATGKELQAFSHKPGLIRALTFSPNGQLLACGENTGVITLWDVATGKEKPGFHRHTTEVTAVGFRPHSGTVLATRSNHAIHLWELASGRELRQIPASYGTPWAFSPDGRSVASTDDSSLFVLDVTTGKELLKVPVHRLRSNLAFSPDGKFLAADGYGRVSLWEVASGKELVQPAIPPLSPSYFVFSPDGKILAQGGDCLIRFWELKTAKQVLEIRVVERKQTHLQITHLSFSANGKILAGTDDTGGIYLWDTTTGKKLLAVGEMRDNVAALSADGQTVVTSGYHRAIHVWEVCTGQLVCEFRGHEAPVSCLALSRDGIRLASGGHDCTAIVWDLLSPPALNVDILPGDPGKQLERAWADLEDRNAAVAYRAICMLVKASDEATRLIGSRLKPAAAIDARQVRQLLADLDSPQFAIRETASRELAKLGATIESELRGAQKASPSVEVQKRLQTLVDELKQGMPPERVREIRAIQVLERIGSKAPRQLLAALAQGQPSAPLSRDAKEALERLEPRPPASIHPYEILRQQSGFPIDTGAQFAESPRR